MSQVTKTVKIVKIVKIVKKSQNLTKNVKVIKNCLKCIVPTNGWSKVQTNGLSICSKIKSMTRLVSDFMHDLTCFVAITRFCVEKIEQKIVPVESWTRIYKYQYHCLSLKSLILRAKEN